MVHFVGVHNLKSYLISCICVIAKGKTNHRNHNYMTCNASLSPTPISFVLILDLKRSVAFISVLFGRLAIEGEPLELVDFQDTQIRVR